MPMLTRLTRLKLFWLDLRQRWALRQQHTSTPDSIASIDPEEFSCLLRSGRKKDLETLARKLSSRRSTRV
jgi:hypothetical protein